jgi:hypothetical protein
MAERLCKAQLGSASRYRFSTQGEQPELMQILNVYEQVSECLRRS